MKKLLLPVILFIIYTSCYTNREEFVIEGKLTNAAKDSWIFLKEYGENTLLPIDSIKINSDGSFRLRGSSQTPSFYIIYTNKGSAVTLITHTGEKITLNGDYAKLSQTYNISGSPESLLQKTLFEELMKTRSKALQILTQRQQANNDSATVSKLEQRFMNTLAQHKLFLMNFIDQNIHSIVSILALYQQVDPQIPTVFDIKNPQDLEYFDKVYNSLNQKYPNSLQVIQLNNYIEQTKQRLATIEQQTQQTQIGTISPDIQLPNTEGKIVPLTSLKGNYILLDFWASWCAPCRAENPNLVTNYNKYKYRNFKIYQVSLDKDKTKWIEAIAKDKLEWTHVSDLKYWNSEAAKTYNIQQIPTNFLLDPEGKIIAQNLRGAKLGETLAKIFGW